MNTKEPIHPIQMAMDVTKDLTTRFGVNKSRSLKITGVSCVGNLFIGLCKLVIGILSMSFFTCISAFYTFGTLLAKVCALTGLIKEDYRASQYRYYKLSGIILIVTGALFIVYSIRPFFYPTTSVYHEYVSLGIATFTFARLVINIKGVITERHNDSPLIHAIRMINLASSLICLALTQTAILSFASQRVNANQKNNGTIGIIMGCAATILGIFMIIYINHIQKSE